MAAPNVGDKVTSGWFPNVTGDITQLFGTFETALGINAPHTGIDIGLPNGAPVQLPPDQGPARVEVAGNYGGYGNAVVLTLADGTTIVLGHLKDVTVRVGQMVNPSDLLGHVDSTGASTGDHLHFEVRQGGTAIDPWQWLRGTAAAAGHAATSAVPGLQGLQDIGTFFKNMTDWTGKTYNWWRLALIATGIVMILYGLYIYFRVPQQVLAGAMSTYRTVPVPTEGA